MADKGSINLDGMTVPELEELIAAARGKIGEIQAEARVTMRAKLEEMAASAGLTLEEIVGAGAAARSSRKPPQKPIGKSVPVKYRSPNGDTWSGRGRPPRWLAVLEAEGKNREDYRV
ncbi:H-NS histone family protein [Roseomonas hellenica]|uniref:H-NS histone family protein n=1 Tax=Plastoroseomonas hellenica TaxID=2687306 RepID=A0ABS5EUS2_9PROT|nr:H-NS histone family protein [Plastoroseomonas hellenica]MBR0663998.1 H-NS histone family protein [Plastoroseomonas hellenica]